MKNKKQIKKNILHQKPRKNGALRNYDASHALSEKAVAIRVNDLVKIIDDTLVYRVKEIHTNEGIVVLDHESYPLIEMPIENIVPYNSIELLTNRQWANSFENCKQEENLKQKNRVISNTLDLHLEKSETRNKTRHNIFRQQLNDFRLFLETAKRQRLKVIHVVTGNGNEFRLQDAVRAICKHEGKNCYGQEGNPGCLIIEL